MSTAAPAATASTLGMIGAQSRAMVIAYWRVPAFAIFSLVLPIMFFTFFGLPHAREKLANGTSVGAYLLGSFGAYAVSSVMVFNFGIGQATARAQKIDLLQRATPLPPFVTIVANVINALSFALVSLLVLFAFVFVAGGVRLSAATWVTLTVRLLFGALPMIGLGMAIGYSSGVNAAPALANLIYLPMSFASGLFIPLNQMPDFVQRIGPFLPTYHYGQLAWNTVGGADESVTRAVLWLAGWTLVLFAVALRAYRLEATRKFA